MGENKMKKILIVEDDNDINQMLCELLSQNGYEVISAFSGTEALMHTKMETFDLVLLDLMLPGKSGAVVLGELRVRSTVPVIILTAVHDTLSVVALLESGANDYVTKPFDNEVLLARVGVQLRSGQATMKGPSGAKSDSSVLKVLGYKELTLQVEAYDATINGKSLQLSKKEYEILKILVENPKKVFTKNNLYESVWQDEFMGDDNTINVHISKIRAKISKVAPDQEYIQTVWGIGFKMQE